MLRYKGAQHFRERIVLATLSGRTVRIDEIRSDDDEQIGLRPFEANFLRLLEKVVNGAEIAISETGTSIRYRPGVITGGGGITHDCGTGRAIGYFVQPLILLAPFAKAPLSITLLGVTNDEVDVGVDVLRTVTLPMLRHFGLDDGVQLQIRKRGAAPLGGGEVLLELPIVRELSPIELVDAGLVRRVRGVAYGMKVSPQLPNRVVSAARATLNHFLPDVWVYTDVFKGKASGNSPGFGVALVSESTTGALLAAEVAGGARVPPESVGELAADGLLEQVKQGGVVDGANQHLALLLMALGKEDVSRLRLGPLTPFAVEMLRLLRDFFGVTFQLDADLADGSVLCTCRGVGFKNLAKRTT